MPQIQVTWFKPSGKWSCTGLVAIGKYRLFKREFKQSIVDNQDQITNGWQEHDYYVMTNTALDQDEDPSFSGFYTHLFLPGSFKGIVKS